MNDTLAQKSNCIASSSNTAGDQLGAGRIEQTRYNTRQNAPGKVNGLPRPPSWLLVEWERSHGEQNTYDVIASTQIVGRAPDRRGLSLRDRGVKDSEYSTGNLIHVQRGERIVPATIVIVSDDKQFIETELQQLRELSTNNLDTKGVPEVRPTQSQKETNYSKQQFYSQGYTNQSERAVQLPERKHRATLQHHVEHQDVVPVKKRQRTDSMPSFNDRTSISPCSVEPTFSAERTITPRLVDRTAYSNTAVQPMTFDQQTQTIGPAYSSGSGDDAHLGKILSYLESIRAEQKSCRMEREHDRKLLNVLHEMLMEHETILNRIEEKIALEPTELKHNTPVKRGANEISVSDNVIEMELSLIDRCLTANDAEKLLGAHCCTDDRFMESTLPETQAHVHQLDANSNQSWMSSVGSSVKIANNTNSNTVSIDENSAVATTSLNTDHVIVQSEKNYVFPVPDQSTVLLAKRSDTIDDLKKDWDDQLEDEDDAGTVRLMSVEEMVSIGSNGTLVRQAALQKIKWSNYKSATRKLLMEVFGKEMLGTHSLSGRPSPALRGDADKPVKDRLQANMVADVIEIVCKMCNISEGMVRNVITAKCADENKMRKHRASLLAKKLNPAEQIEPRHLETITVVTNNKENIC